MEERSQQYNDLLSGLKAINFVSPDAPNEQQYLLMWLLEKYSLMRDKNTQVKDYFITIIIVSGLHLHL